MKKTYIKPSLQILSVESQSILSTSLGYTDSDGDPDQPIYSREYDIDFDDDTDW